MRQDEGIDVVFDVVKPVARGRHGYAEEIAAARWLLSLIVINPLGVELLAAFWIDLHHLPVQGIGHQQMAIRRHAKS